MCRKKDIFFIWKEKTNFILSPNEEHEILLNPILGSKLVFNAKRVSSGDGTKGESVGGILGGTGAKFLGDRKKEVDSDKLREPDGESEKRRGKLPSLQAKPPRQSQTPRARFE